MGILIKNGEIITSTDRFKADIYIKSNKISAIAEKIKKASGDTVVDAFGKFVFPGGIDVHTHLDMPFMGTTSSDDFESGTIAAVCGGTTTIIDFIMPEKNQSLLDAFTIWQKKAKDKAVVDYGFHIAITNLTEKIKKEIPKIIEKGVSSFKIFMAYKGSLQLSAREIISVLGEIKKYNGLVLVHAEDGDAIADLENEFIQDHKTEAKFHELSHQPIFEKYAVSQIINFCKLTKSSVYIVHLSTKDALEEIKKAKLNGIQILAETCPQYLVLTNEKYKNTRDAMKYVMSPPLRTKNDNEALWEGLSEGFIQAVSTDHCPFRFKDQKILGKGDFRKIPNGCPGIEDRLKLLYTYGVLKNKISINKFVELTSTIPSKIFGLFPRKGTIAIGSDADIVVFDPHIEATFGVNNSHHNCDYNAYEGLKYEGSPSVVIVNGEIVYKSGKFCGKPGSGKFIKRMSANYRNI